MNAWHDDGLDDSLDAFLDGPFSADFATHAGDASHIGDGAGANPFDLHDDMLVDGPLPHYHLPDPRRIEALVHAATGVRFDALAAYAEPLLNRFGYDIQEALALSLIADRANAEGSKTTIADVDETLVTLLETARLLWAFFSMGEPDRDAHRPTLLAHCYGPDADAEAWDEFADLLDAMEAAWEALPHGIRDAAVATDTATLSFETLLDAAADSVFDPGRECDARALFALPMLDDPDVQADPTRFEAALHRADAYWTLAQQSDRAARIDSLLHTLADSPADLMVLRTEAERMLARYDDLFSA